MCETRVYNGSMSIISRLKIAILPVVLFLGSLLPGTVNAGETDYGFKALADIESQALTFCKDRDGFVWVGTYVDGLYRFDGKKLKRHTIAGGFITSNNISAILEDRRGILWFAGAGGGLTRYDKDRNDIRHFTHNPTDPSSLSSNSFFWAGKNILAQDRGGDIWIGTIGGGLNRFSIREQKFFHFRHKPDDDNSLSSDNVRAVLADSRNRIWIGTEKGLNRLDPVNGTVERLHLEQYEKYGQAPRIVMAIFEAPGGTIWVGTENNGLYRYDDTFGGFASFRFDPKNPGTISADRVVHLAADDQDRLVVSHGDKSSLYLPGEDRFIRITGPYRDLTMSFTDRTVDRVWGLTDSGKLLIKTPFGNFFKGYAPVPGNPNSLSSEIVISIFEDSGGILWISTLKGLNRYNPVTGRFTRLFNDPDDPGTIPSAADYSPGIFEDRQGNLWIGSSVPSALSLVDKQTGRCIKTYFPDPDDPNSLPDAQQINRMIQEKENPHIMWISTAKGLVRFDRQTETFTTFGHDNSWSLLEDPKGYIWFSTWGNGLGRFDKKTGTFTYFRHDPNDPASISDNLLVPIFTAADGRIWIGTENGLNLFNPETVVFTRFTRAGGYPFDAVHSIGEDRRGILWLGTNKGLVRFDPESHKTRAFTREDGVSSTMFYANNGIMTRNGELWFGGTKGMISFFPEQIRANAHIPPVRITEIRQGGDPARFGRAPERLDRIAFDWQSNFFEFEFAAFDYVNPGKNQYAYMLEGFDKEWFFSGTNNFGRYSGLPPGNYRLRLRGSNNDGVWNEAGQRLTVSILPPFWKTGWFYTFLAVSALACAAVITFYVLRLNSEVRERQQAQAELNRSNRRLRQLDRLKDEFLANTSHELRTPLTGIIGLSESLVEGASGPLAPKAKKDLAMIIASGRRLANLVNDILDFSKLRHKDLELKKKAVDMRSLAQVVLAISHPLTAGKPLVLENKIPPDTPFVEGDENRIQQILFNLVGNAIKFTAEGKVTVSAQTVHDMVEIMVIDSGIGIPEEKHDTVFESFEQADGSIEREFSGTGLGLAVSKKLVELHGGTIGLNSSPGKGSMFFFTLPAADRDPETVTDRRPLLQVMDPESESLAFSAPVKEIDLSNWSADKPNILVVDDEAVNLEVLSNQLSLEDYRVTRVSSGPDALRAVETLAEKGQSFDLILLDVMMPRMSGYEVCRILRETYPPDTLPVVMLTAKTRAEDLAAGLASGANDYLTKPFNKTELLARIKNQQDLRDLIRKREENRAALASSEKKYRDLFNNLVDVFFRTDDQGNLTLVSPSFEKVTGFPSRDALGKNLVDLLSVNGACREKLLDVLDKKGEVEGFEARIVHQNGSPLWVVASARYYTARDHTPAGIEGLFRDITRTRQAEQIRDLLAAVIEQASEFIVITDTSGKILYVNPAFEKGTGYPRSEAVGRTPAILKSGRHAVSFYRNLWETITDGRTWKGRFTNKRRDGSIFEEEATITPVKDESDSITHYVAVKRDVTKELRLEKQLIQSQKMESIGTLAGGIAHDFNNILTAIMGNAEIALMDAPEGQVKKSLEKVVKASNRAKDLVRQILDFSRQTEVKPVPVKVRYIAAEAVKLLRSSLPASIEIRSRLMSKASTLADPTQIHQVLMNLCTNANHAMREKGGILTIELTDVSAGSDDLPEAIRPQKCAYIRIRVSDTGSGIAPEIQERIFDPFYTTKAKGEGTGMGLSVVHGIVSRYRGAITLDSRPGEGTRFDVFLPVFENRESESRPDGSELLFGSERILFVDDEELQTDLGRRILEKIGYRVTAQTDPLQALDLFTKAPDRFDAVITDMTMPKMSGDRLSREILAIRPDIPIILCTGYSEKISEKEALAMGIKGFAAKPVAMHQMAGILRSVLEA